ncbi:hypothetical protein ABBQ38_009088 [Trebouxia sp. C0009 RCD-2024]
MSLEASKWTKFRLEKTMEAKAPPPVLHTHLFLSGTLYGWPWVHPDKASNSPHRRCIPGCGSNLCLGIWHDTTLCTVVEKSRLVSLHHSTHTMFDRCVVRISPRTDSVFIS